MRLLRNLAVPVVLCLILGATTASAQERPSVPAGREAGGMARILDRLQAFLKAVWEHEGAQIDPLGRNSPGAGGGSGDEPATPGADEGWQIDPWG